MNLLIIDDDKNLLLFLKNNLEERAFFVTICESGKKGLKQILKGHYDLIIIDLNLPDLSGCQLCEQARENQILTPILILSGENGISNKIKLLDSGADDYLTKPFCIEELVARIYALARRPLQIEKNTIKIKNLEIDFKRQLVKRGQQIIYLTRKEYLILELLARSPDKIFSRTEISEKAWDIDIDPFSKVIEMHILNLRNKIDKPYKTKIIKTMAGRGYKIK